MEFETKEIYLTIPVTVKLEHHKGFPGEWEKGGLQISPAEPPFVEVRNTWINGCELPRDVVDYFNDEMYQDILEGIGR